MKKITEFKGDYRFLSNFHPVKIEYEGLTYPSVEHAYQAAKTTNKEKRKEFTEITSPVVAKRKGRRVELREDWDQVKISIMEELLSLKFKQEPFRSKLIATGDTVLEEGNKWNDRFWGVCPPGSNKGENNLGKLLMKIRENLKGEKDDNSTEDQGN